MLSIECPACEGFGGSVEPVLDDGSGPWEPCGFCQGSGRLKLWKLGSIYWAFRVVREEKEARRRRINEDRKRSK